MSWTPPRTWVVNELVAASLVNTHIRDNELYLKDAPTFDGNVAVTGTLNVTGSTTIGGLVDASGAAAGQLKFPATQNASANANTLDDYEEGTWTPTIGGSGGQSGQAYTVQQGSYVKIGKNVYAQFNIVLSAKGTITTNAQIQGLPFTAENTSNQTFAAGPIDWTNMTTAMAHLSGTLAPNATAITLKHIAGVSAQNAQVVLQDDLSNTTQLIGTIAYQASA